MAQPISESCALEETLLQKMADALCRHTKEDDARATHLPIFVKRCCIDLVFVMDLSSCQKLAFYQLELLTKPGRVPVLRDSALFKLQDWRQHPQTSELQVALLCVLAPRNTCSKFVYGLPLQ